MIEIEEFARLVAKMIAYQSAFRGLNTRKPATLGNAIHFEEKVRNAIREILPDDRMLVAAMEAESPLYPSKYSDKITKINRDKDW